MSPGNVSGMFLDTVFFVVWISMRAKNSEFGVETSNDLNFLNGKRSVEGQYKTVIFSIIMDHNSFIFG